MAPENPDWFGHWAINRHRKVNYNIIVKCQISSKKVNGNLKIQKHWVDSGYGYGGRTALA